MSETYVLPWPPTANTIWRRSGARTLLSREGRAYRANVAAACFGSRRFGATARLSVTIEASPPDNRRRDLDNLLKSTLDAMMHAGVYCDDSQIDDLRIVRCGRHANGVLRVRVVALT